MKEFIFLLLFSTTLAAQYSLPIEPPVGVQVDWSHPHSQDLVGWWMMNEGTGKTIYDLVNGLTGTLTNMEETDWTHWSNGAALDLDGSNEYVNLGTPDVLNITGDKLTLAVWCKKSSDNPFDYVFAKSDGGANVGYAIDTGGGPGYIRCWIHTGSLDIVDDQVFSWTSDNKYHWIVSTYDGVNLRLYLDAVESLASPTAASGNITSSSAQAAHIGAIAASAYFLGQVADVRIWKRVLSQDEIKDIYTFPYISLLANTIIAKRLFPAIPAAAPKKRRIKIIIGQEKTLADSLFFAHLRNYEDTEEKDFN